MAELADRDGWRARSDPQGTAASALACNYPPGCQDLAPRIKSEHLHQLPAQPGNSSRGGPRLTTIRVSLAGSVSMARVPPTRSWLMRVPSVPGEVSRVLRRPSPAARLPGGCPGGDGGQGWVSGVPCWEGTHPQAGVSPLPRQGSFCLGDMSLGKVSALISNVTATMEMPAGASRVRDGYRVQGWVTDTHGQGRRAATEGGKEAKHLQPPLPSSRARRSARPRGWGKMQLQQRGTSVAGYSMSPAIGPLLRAGMGSGCWGRLQAFISKRNVSLVPSCRVSPCPAPAPGSERSPETQHRTGKVCGAGGMKRPFGTKSAEIHEISWQLGTGGGGADGTRSPTGRDRARTSVPSERDSKNTRRGRGLLLLPLREDSCLHPWGEGVNCCLTSSWSPPELSHGAGFCSQFLQEGKLRQGGAGLSWREQAAGGMSPTAHGWGKGLCGWGSHSPSLGALGGARAPRCCWEV